MIVSSGDIPLPKRTILFLVSLQHQLKEDDQARHPVPPYQRDQDVTGFGVNARIELHQPTSSPVVLYTLVTSNGQLFRPIHAVSGRQSGALLACRRLSSASSSL